MNKDLLDFLEKHSGKITISAKKIIVFFKFGLRNVLIETDAGTNLDLRTSSIMTDIKAMVSIRSLENMKVWETNDERR